MPPVLAAFKTTSMRQPFQEGFVSVVAHRITIRFPGHSYPITDGMRVVKGSAVYLIQAVENVQERNRVLHLNCIRIDGDRVSS
jgi:head-tail adaptor